jgi:cellulose synthase/poly-beta-1,6-N-acetylglucosamine synthase-like glycosyltransferase
MKGNPCVSVVVTANNAESSMGDCLMSVAESKDHYPGEVEIILVNDRSEDRTSEVALNLGIHGLKVIDVLTYDNTGLTARQLALDKGFTNAKGEVIMVTDADAIVPGDWIYKSVQTMKENSADAVAGMIGFRPGTRFLAKLQSVDAIFYFFICGLLNFFRLSSGIFFGNFAFKRDIYHKVGGFERQGFALTEDLQFGRAMIHHGYSISFCRDYELMVSVKGVESFKELVGRSRRVSSGGFSILSFGMSLWLLSLVLLAFLSLGNGLMLVLLGVRYAIGVGFAVSILLNLRRFSLLPFGFFYEPAALIIGVCTMISLVLDKYISWGGISYAR